jgi:hypothetical protein
MDASVSSRCRVCGQASSDRRWAPFCPACYEATRSQQRRLQTRPPALERSLWAEPAMLAARLERALGPLLP